MDTAVQSSGSAGRRPRPFCYQVIRSTPTAAVPHPARPVAAPYRRLLDRRRKVAGPAPARAHGSSGRTCPGRPGGGRPPRGARKVVPIVPVTIEQGAAPMRPLRRILLSTALAATLVLAPVTAASADHTGDGCEHRRTTQAHDRVPDRNHQAHSSIPYCPPHDAPRHRDKGHGHG